MNKITAWLKYNFEISFIFFNALLSVIGIFAAMAAAKIDQYDNPFLIALPISFFFWILFGLFAKTPSEKYTEEEMEAIKKLHVSPDAKSPPKIVEHIARLILNITIALFTIILLTDFSMMIFISLKMAIARSSFFH